MDALSYLQRRCSLRRNVLTGETLYAPQGTDDYQPLSREARNTLILEAAREGVDVADETLDRFVHSTLVTDWNPAEEWLDGLDSWDGTDRVADLANRIITSNADWVSLFHKWMLQMVARWTGREVAHRDNIVPVIVGQFGFGKTSFCGLLLPPSLRRYYTDQIKLRSTAEVHQLVVGNLLLCIDEFYQENTDQACRALSAVALHPSSVRPMASRSCPAGAWPPSLPPQATSIP